MSIENRLLAKFSLNQRPARVPLSTSSSVQGGELDQDVAMTTAAYKRERYANDPEYRAREIARSSKRYANNPNHKKKVLAYSRERYANDPEYFASWHRKRKYGLDEQTYRSMMEACGCRCPICKTLFNDKIINFKPVVDHCHRTGCVRGILCQSCNLALTRFMDDPKLLRAAAHYLENQPQDNPKKGGLTNVGNRPSHH